MKPTYHLSQRCIAYILLASLSLQSCYNLPNSPIVKLKPKENSTYPKKQREHLKKETLIKEKVELPFSLTQSGEEVNLQLLPEDEGKWQAEVERVMPGFSRKDTLPVVFQPGYIAEDFYKHSLDWQKRHIRLEKDRVVVGKTGLLGGMKERNQLY